MIRICLLTFKSMAKSALLSGLYSTSEKAPTCTAIIVHTARPPATQYYFFGSALLSPLIKTLYQFHRATDLEVDLIWSLRISNLVAIDVSWFIRDRG